MRKKTILHIGLASHFTEGLGYQDNLLTQQNLDDGYDVVYISNCFKYTDGTLVETPPEDTMLQNGMRLIRIPYQKIVNAFISSKIRKVRGLYETIEKIEPDIILFHGVTGYELKTVGRYKKNYPEVSLFLDSHETSINSAKNFISKFFLHKLYYRSLLQDVYPYVKKILFTNYSSKDFVLEMYKIPEIKMHFFPLGRKIIFPDEKKRIRQRVRKALQVSDDTLVFTHSGKLDEGKRTKEVLDSFYDLKEKKANMWILGTIPEEMEDVLIPLIKRDQRVLFIGWVSDEELRDYITASDFYLQPGTPSATMEGAVASGIPVMLYPYTAHKPFMCGNGFFVKTSKDIKKNMKQIVEKPALLKEMSLKSYEIAKNTLDYRKIAAILYD